MRDPLAALEVVVIRIDQARAGQLGHRQQPFQGKLPELNGGVVDDQQRVGGRASSPRSSAWCGSRKVNRPPAGHSLRGWSRRRAVESRQILSTSGDCFNWSIVLRVCSWPL